MQSRVALVAAGSCASAHLCCARRVLIAVLSWQHPPRHCHPQRPSTQPHFGTEGHTLWVGASCRCVAAVCGRVYGHGVCCVCCVCRVCVLCAVFEWLCLCAVCSVLCR